MKWGSEL